MLRKLVENEVEKQGLEYKQLAHQIGVSPTALSNFIHGKTENKFYSILKLVRKLFPEREYELMEHYIHSQEKHENLRLAMEYCSFHNLHYTLDQLVKTQLSSPNSMNREWALVYALDCKCKSGDISSKDLIHQAKNLAVKHNEMKVMKQWLEIEGLYKEKKFDSIPFFIDDMTYLIFNLHNEFLQKHFSTRLNIVLANIYLWQGDIEKCRTFANEVISDGADQLRVAKMYVKLGLSYLFESYEKALKCFNQAKTLFNDAGYEEMAYYTNANIAFVSNVWGQPFDVSLDLEKPFMLQEVAFYEIKQGNKTRAREILNQLKDKPMDKVSLACQCFYNGLLESSTSDFYKSIKLFIECGNRFLANLPYLELKKAGEDPAILEVIETIFQTQALKGCDKR